jgi:hypothetical protein
MIVFDTLSSGSSNSLGGNGLEIPSREGGGADPLETMSMLYLYEHIDGIDVQLVTVVPQEF